MRRPLIAALLMIWGVVPARGDMTLFLREVSDGVAMHLRGSIDTSAFISSAGSASYSGTGSYSHGQLQMAATGGALGVVVKTSVISGAVDGDYFSLNNDHSITRIGTAPPLRVGSPSLSPAPPFWFGFSDTTQTSGPSGVFRDSVYLPDGYVSNEFVKFDYVARRRTLAALGLSLGDRWGVSFPSGGRTESMIFYVVPEPSTLVGVFVAGIAFAAFGRRNCRDDEARKKMIVVSQPSGSKPAHPVGHWRQYS